MQKTFVRVKFDVIHSAVMDHQAAEGSSRVKSTGTHQMPIDDEIMILNITKSLDLKWKGE